MFQNGSKMKYRRMLRCFLRNNKQPETNKLYLRMFCGKKHVSVTVVKYNKYKFKEPVR